MSDAIDTYVYEVQQVMPTGLPLSRGLYRSRESAERRVEQLFDRGISSRYLNIERRAVER